MIITDDFIMLNFPKTGSSFARKVIKQLYGEHNSHIRKLMEKLCLCSPRVRDFMLPKIDVKVNYKAKDQHGTLRQIPESHRGKRIVSITRNPLERYVSTYFFKWWQSFPPADIHTIREKYPHFPDLSFPEYYEMTHLYGKQNRLQNIVPKIDLGLHTIQFIQFYFHDPEAVLTKIDHQYIEQEDFRRDMGSVEFLHQENLNSELRLFLIDVGFNENQLKFIDSLGKVNITEKKEKAPRLSNVAVESGFRNTILERDKLMFKIFPEYLSRA